MSDVIKSVHSEDGKTIVKCVQDVEPTLEFNKAIIADGGTRPGDAMQLQARIPRVLLIHWLNEAGMSMNDLFNPAGQAWLRRKLNDPDNSFIRVAKGKL